MEDRGGRKGQGGGFLAEGFWIGVVWACIVCCPRKIQMASWSLMLMILIGGDRGWRAVLDWLLLGDLKR